MYVKPYEENGFRTKYLGGHSDLCVGVVTLRTLEQWQKLQGCRTLMGGVMVGNLVFVFSEFI